MKKVLSILLVVIILMSTFVSCGYEISIKKITTATADDYNGKIRTTITKEEWDKTMQMNNFTVTETISIYPEHLRVMSVTKDAIKTDWSGDVSYSVNENGAFYSLYQLDGEWYGYLQANYDPSYTTLSYFYNISSEFDELIYNSQNKTYIEHVVLTENYDYYCEYSFENVILKQFRVYDDYYEAEGYYLISNIGTTVVDVPEYVPLSTRYALEVMPNGGGFEQIDISSDNLPSTIKEVHKASNGGYVFQVEFSGFSSGNIAYIGIDDEGKITGTKIIINNEVPGYGADVLPELDANGYYNGLDFSNIDGVDTISGCTVSTKAYKSVIKDALKAALILESGDAREQEQLLNDNLNAALGAEGVEFEKHFFTEVVEGVDTIYVAKNGIGYVVVILDNYIGFDANGNFIASVDQKTNPTTVSNDKLSIAQNAIDGVINVTFTDIDLSLYSAISKRVISAKVTNGGVYVLEVEGSGFGKKGPSDYGASGEYLVIRIALTADGKIIDCYTVYQNETNYFGDVCATEEFYGQFAGKTQDNYEDIIIVGCTYTTDGYHGAIKNAFKAVTIFEGTN